MSSTINNAKFIQTMGAAILVIAGVVTKNSNEQYKADGRDPAMKNNIDMLGAALFTIGWLYTAYVLSKNKTNDKKLYLVVPCLAILGSVMMMKQMMKKGEQVPMYLPVIFAGAWIALGYFVGVHLPQPYKFMGLIASAFVIISMLFTLPEQRKSCIVDGPGMVLFTLAWVLIAFLNSKK